MNTIAYRLHLRCITVQFLKQLCFAYSVNAEFIEAELATAYTFEDGSKIKIGLLQNTVKVED